jgi:DNA helicase-2/ATP-dependent DNA helicase PcrA
MAGAMPEASESPLARALREAAAELAALAPAGARDEQDASLDTPGAPQLEVLVDMLTPLAARCSDLDQFLTELAMDSEIDLWDPRADRVSLLTLHAAKGLEFRVVFLVGCEDGILPMRWGPVVRADELADGVRTDALAERAVEPGEPAMSLPDGSDDEERRLFFVGMTRAKERLYLVHARKRLWRGKPCELPLSPFVCVIEERLLSRQTSRAPKPPRRVPAPHEQLGLF